MKRDISKTTTGTIGTLTAITAAVLITGPVLNHVSESNGYEKVNTRKIHNEKSYNIKAILEETNKINPKEAYLQDMEQTIQEFLQLTPSPIYAASDMPLPDINMSSSQKKTAVSNLQNSNNAADSVSTSQEIIEQAPSMSITQSPQLIQEPPIINIPSTITETTQTINYPQTTTEETQTTTEETQTTQYQTIIQQNQITDPQTTTEEIQTSSHSTSTETTQTILE